MRAERVAAGAEAPALTARVSELAKAVAAADRGRQSAGVLAQVAAERLADAEARVTVADSRASATEARAAQAEADRASTLERLLAGAIDAQAHSNDGRDAAVHEPDGIGLRPVRSD